ncbi:alginate lyase family protein [Natronogracilivirga saccharolytica]|uniref:Alginate lyase family protein n=1 Tax=Natronogracilivirga saccharolytica TaxID=2812953 RepID=A0A8J7RPK1_9BACT|nr:alginate lyase family protein [Natronogracilivirga saccharolytica]MBP3193818.1 alginate lyase family protein [Natronogracilivirga saccharolytica]
MRDQLFPVEVPVVKNASGFQEIKLHPFPKQFKHYFGDGKFFLLNKKFAFDETICWNYTGYGKLWAYHLNYFDFLHQPGMMWDTGKELIDDFLKDIQKRKIGMEPYPISLRTINWVKFMTVHNCYSQEIVDSLNAHFQVLQKKLEFHLLANHLLENGFSLLFGAVFFQDEKITHLTRRILTSELEEQILDDGAHFELSPMYHVILLQRALDGYNLLINNYHNLKEVQDLLKHKIQMMVNWLNTIIFSNGDIPMFNDSTQGQALDPKTILDYAKQFGFHPGPLQLSESGYRKFEVADTEIVTDVGPSGPDYQPGHAHCDIFSFVLYHNGKPVIVDRGISTYQKNYLREEERGTASHNTVMVNGEEQSDVWCGFRLGRRARTTIREDRNDYLSAEHDGYRFLGITHHRTWSLKDSMLEVNDHISGPDHDAEAYFHFPPDITPRQLSGQKYQCGPLVFRFHGAEHVNTDTYEYCQGFNKRTPSKKLVVRFRGELQTVISK